MPDFQPEFQVVVAEVCNFGYIFLHRVCAMDRLLTKELPSWKPGGTCQEFGFM